ncbi:hypothetical protein BJ741DRAFT_579951 [Chytriomyces cf. hyalinus JEL632]|nr:hypothetical protein BJ741DRAFT_579951 [Chytriomyces cf. hyalinus JEL632]
MYQHSTSPITINVPSCTACVQYMAEHSAEIHGFYYNTQTTVCGAKVFDSLPGNDLFMYTTIGYVDMGPVGGAAAVVADVFTRRCLHSSLVPPRLPVQLQCPQTTNLAANQQSKLRNQKNPFPSLLPTLVPVWENLQLHHQARPYNSQLPTPQQKAPHHHPPPKPQESSPQPNAHVPPQPSPSHPTHNLTANPSTRRVISIFLEVVAVFIVIVCVAV